MLLGKSIMSRTIRYEFVILTLVITVVVMNVYVGLLGELYHKAERRCRRIASLLVIFVVLIFTD